MGAFRPRVPAVSRVALRANIEVYEHSDERTMVSGSPHIKHPTIRRLYLSLVEDAIARIGKHPTDVSVLELGAGNGLASIPWFQKRVRLTAVDSSDAMLQQLRRRAQVHGVTPRTVNADVFEYLSSTDERFDLVSVVSMLHHIPDYLGLLDAGVAHLQKGGVLMTFQDPLRYDTMPSPHHAIERACYFAWRVGQGNYRRGLKTRWRRIRHVYDPDEPLDFEEYHVVRNGVDAEAIMGRLEGRFEKARLLTYWSTYSGPLQWIGEKAGLTSSFAILASGRRPD